MHHTAFKGVFLAAIVASAPWCMATCLQDQYGNQYQFTQTDNEAVIGTATNAQGCGTAPWPLIGAYIHKNGGIQLELTASNPAPGGCQPIYMLKGTYPNFGWYYDYGYGGQESVYVECGAQDPVTARPGQGALR